MVDTDQALVRRNLAILRDPAVNDERLQVVLSDQRNAESRSGYGFIPRVLGAVGAIALGLWITFSYPAGRNIDPLDFKGRTERVLATTPLIDGHNDLPYLLRLELKNKINDESKFSFRDSRSFLSF